jgi:hypothetical protein
MDPIRRAAPLLAVLLAACSASSDGSGRSFRESVGLAAPPPNEFLVVSRAPLQIPASTATLPPPQPGAQSRVEPDPSASARAALLGEATVESGPAAPPSAGEAALVAAVGPSDPAVRQQLEAETPESERRFGLDGLFGYEFPDPQADAERLSSAEEAERLRAEGLPTPTAPPAPQTE